MCPHDDPENGQHNPKLTFSDCREGTVLVSNKTGRLHGGLDFYLVVLVDRQARRLLVRSVDGSEWWSPWWAFDQAITQQTAEILGARWRVAPQERPRLVGPARHPHNPLKD